MPIPYAIDPSLHPGPPAETLLGDGFTPPWRAATHPVEPPAPETGPQEAEPNTSRLPVEPEFPAEWRPVEPEEPGPQDPEP